MKILNKQVLFLLTLILLINIAFYIYSLELNRILFFISIIIIGCLFWTEKDKFQKSNLARKELDSELLDDVESHIDIKKIQPIVNIIEAHKSVKFFSMALFGVWGSGKSSYLTTLEKHLKNDYECIYLNVWELEDSANAINELKKEFDNIIFKYNKSLWLVNIIIGLFSRDYFSLLSKYFIKSEIKTPHIFENTLKNTKNKYNELLLKTLDNKKIIIMIDEVDRLHDKQEILNIFKVIRYTASFNNVFVLTALDLVQINKKLTDDKEYIHKIFTIKYAIPNIDKNEIIKYFRQNIFNKFSFCITSKELEYFLTHKHEKSEKLLLDIIPTYRVIKSSFNDTYIFTKSLNCDIPEWQSYISFGFIYIINILKAMNFKDYTHLIINSNLSKVMELIKKDNKEELAKVNLEQSTIELLYFLLEPPYEYRIEILLDIYQAYKIYDYNISDKQYNSYIENINNIDKDLKELELREYKTAFLNHLISIIYEDTENQHKILEKIVDLILENKESLDYRDLLEKIVVKSIGTLISSKNQTVLRTLFDDKEMGYEFISLVFDNQKLSFFGKQIDYEVVLYLFENWIKSIDCASIDSKELEEIFKNLFLRNLTLANIEYYQKEQRELSDESQEELNFTNTIRKLIVENCIKYHKDATVKIILESMPLEYVKKFFEDNGLNVIELLNNDIKYQVKVASEDNSYLHQYLSGIGLKDTFSDI